MSVHPASVFGELRDRFVQCVTPALSRLKNTLSAPAANIFARGAAKEDSLYDFNSKGTNPTILFTLLHPDAVVPKYETVWASGMDIKSVETRHLRQGHTVKIATGLSVQIPEGFEGQIRPRSGLAAKHGVTVLNAPGTIDSDYRGEICVLLINLGRDMYMINCGDRIAQLVIAPVVQPFIKVVEALGTTERGSGGFGSTGV